MATAAFPTLIANIITALQGAASLSTVRIFDGPEIDETYPGDAIAVGHDGNDDGDLQAATIRNSYDQLGAKRMFEDGTINCSLWAWDGTTDLTARRVRVYQILSAVDTVIRLDPSFSGACLYSGLENHSPTYRQTNAGAVVIINFTIAYRART
jgi:hypothetical protein